MQDTLLVEIITEELPPKLLQNLSNSFSEGVFNGLDKNFLLTPESKLTAYVTPRRLAVSITSVLDAQAEREVERRGPAVTAAYDVSGKETPALQGFARSCGVAVDDLKQEPDTKGILCYIYKHKQPGQSLGNILIKILQALLPKIPAPKMMRWGDGNENFIRPAHNFIMLHGRNLLCESAELLGLQSTKSETLGHRFLSKGRIELPNASEYEKALFESGYVIASFEKRKKLIIEKLHNASKKENGNIVQDAMHFAKQVAAPPRLGWEAIPKAWEVMDSSLEDGLFEGFATCFAQRRSHPGGVSLRAHVTWAPSLLSIWTYSRYSPHNPYSP